LCEAKIRAEAGSFMKPKNGLRSVATIAAWCFGEHRLNSLELGKLVGPECLQEPEPYWDKIWTPADADFLRELNIAVNPAEVLQPGEKTLGRQILERFWAEDR
jgi:hypothetical protein